MKKFMRVIVLCCLVLLAAGATGLGGYFVGKAEGQENDRVVRLFFESSVAKKLATHELIEGRLTFPGAIERFRTINNANPKFSWEVLRAAFPGVTEEECLGRQVIAGVNVEMLDQPEQAKALIARLESELIGLATPGGE